MPRAIQRSATPPVAVRRLPTGTAVVALLGTGNVSKPPGAKGRSWIAYYKDHTGMHNLTCCAEGCYNCEQVSGAHVKVADGPAAAALLHRRWYIVPTCPQHNKRSSCKTFRVKQVYAVEAAPSVADRVRSWGADVRKVVRTVLRGKKR
jgi:hypothetical protein